MTPSVATRVPAARAGAARPSRLRWVLLAVGLVAALALPWFVYPPVAMDIVALALFAIALDILLGYTGLLSFGHAAFWGSSAYVTGTFGTVTSSSGDRRRVLDIDLRVGTPAFDNTDELRAAEATAAFWNERRGGVVEDGVDAEHAHAVPGLECCARTDR